MKSADVLRTLRITRQTLTKYVKNGTIKVKELPNGRYDYDEASVYAFLNKDVQRKTYVYARVFMSKQKADLENQVKQLKQFCFANGWRINGVYQDVASGISFEKRNAFFEMFDDIIEGRVERIVITYKDRLSRVGFDLFKYMFDRFNCRIVVMSDVGSEKLDNEEILDDMETLLNCYSMKYYSSGRVKKLKEVIRDDGDEG